MIAAVSAALFAGGTTGVASAAPIVSHEQMVDLPDGGIHVTSSGAPAADAVVLVHGLAGSTAWWDAVLPALQDRYVVRIDLLGHGKSAKPDGGYSMAEQARRVGVVLDRLGVRHAVVVGHSTGGYVATALAEQRHDLVTALALIDTGPRLDAFTDNGPAGDLLLNPAIGQPLWPLLPNVAIRYSLSSAFTRDVRIPDQIVADVRAMTYRSLTATSNASDAYLRERSEPDRVADLGLPTMVVFGARDRRWSPASFEDYRRVPRIRIEPLDCGHTPMIEEPEATGALLRDFAEHH
ncbi:alpha/beta fold hydrolase [Nocardia panacis]|uniref:Alpha/beta fold hydrolase n=2 Tax=Nocardia panacis TaxID=2340916 RepID=A0A3A4K1Y6_9NOCA|nr:alpha/beta fold hydrolase [Nocardia panacis]